jgi:hypothetical protein
MPEMTNLPIGRAGLIFVSVVVVVGILIIFFVRRP